MPDHLLAKIGQYGLILNNENKILILQRIQSKEWSLPGGRLGEDEREWLASLKREIKEETGLDISGAKPIDVNIIEDPYQVKYCVYFKVVTDNLDKIQPSKEHSNYKFVGLEELKELSMEYDSVKQIMIKFLENK